MALFIPGGPAGGAPSGGLGSIVFSHGRSGAIMRTRVIPTNPGSAAQVLARNRMADLTNRWHNTLNAAQRAAWDTYGTNVPVLNRIGQQIYLTGINWYVACNSLRNQAGGTLVRVDDAPTIFNLASFSLVSITVSEATQQISIAYASGDNWTFDDGALCAYATRPMNPSVNYNNQPFRFADAIEGDTAAPPAAPQTFPLPFPVVADQAVWTRFNCVIADGRIGASQQYRVIVGA